MARKDDAPMIVARFGDRVVGWVGNHDGGILYGDQEWIDSAKAVAAVGLEYTLYEDIDLKADIDDPSNPAGAFAALAWLPKERIRIEKAPEGMMNSIGLLDAPGEVDYFEGWDGEITDEDRLFIETHVELTVNGESVWVPLKSLKSGDDSRNAAIKLLQRGLNQNA